MALIEYCLLRCVCLYGVGCLCSEYDCSIASESPIKWCYISSISIFPQLDSIVVFLPILVCKLVSCTRSPYHVRYMIQQDCCLLQQWRPPAVLCVWPNGHDPPIAIGGFAPVYWSAPFGSTYDGVCVCLCHRRARRRHPSVYLPFQWGPKLNSRSQQMSVCVCMCMNVLVLFLCTLSPFSIYPTKTELSNSCRTAVSLGCQASANTNTRTHQANDWKLVVLHPNHPNTTTTTKSEFNLSILKSSIVYNLDSWHFASRRIFVSHDIQIGACLDKSPIFVYWRSS